MIVVNSLFPIFILVGLGRILKTSGFIQDEFFKTSDKLVYFIFFPAMLFWKISQNSAQGAIDMALPLAALTAVLITFILSTLFILTEHVSDYEAGSFSQSCYRFNTYIGMAIMVTVLDDQSVLLFGILIGFAIPVINVLSVSILIWFSANQYNPAQRLRHLALAIISNPLILACCLGIGVYALNIRFPAYINNTFRLLSMVTLPMALLSIGSDFSLKNLKGHLKLSVISSLFKLLFLPVVGFYCLKWFHVKGPGVTVGMIFFCLPTSTAIYVLSSQMGSDTRLASASIVFSTLVSMISLTWVLIFVG
ncbi:MAG: AEC family transporter [Desulfobacteraceae bacterium]|nr:MAG: AEC family transporter [Desulfobacteraceae bacterium]